MQGIIFDMDGLMLDSERIIYESVVKAGHEMGLVGIEETALSTIGTNNAATKVLYERAYAGVDFSRLMDLKHKYVDEIICENGFPPKDGIKELLDYVVSRGYNISVGSSTRRGAVEYYLGKVGLLDYFTVLVCGDSGLPSKPAPDIFLACAEQMGTEPAECFVLEDSVNGIKAAYSAGMKPIMVPDLIMPTDEIKSMLYALKNNLTEVIGLL